MQHDKKYLNVALHGLEKVIGSKSKAEAKIAGITPAVLILRGKCDD